MTLYPLFGDRFCHALGVSSLKLSGEEIPKPALQEGGDAPHEEEPHPPAWRPESAAWTLTHRTLGGTGTANKVVFIYYI